MQWAFQLQNTPPTKPHRLTYVYSSLEKAKATLPYQETPFFGSGVFFMVQYAEQDNLLTWAGFVLTVISTEQLSQKPN